MVKMQKGDATVPVKSDKLVIIAHVCNNVDAWGRGFVVPLGNKYPMAKEAFHRAKRDYSSEEVLGKVQLTSISPVLYIANMFEQNGLRSKANPIPLKMDSLEKCLRTVFKLAASKKAIVQMPKIGAGLAGGNWNEIFKLIELVSSEYDVECYILEL